MSRMFKGVLSIALFLLGCEDEPIAQPVTGSPSKRRVPAAQAKTAPKDDASSVPPPIDFQETAFVESERSRDPFRSYAAFFMEEARGAVQSQREVVLEQYAIEDLRLVAIVQRLNPAKAMFVDPTGLGHSVQRGQYIGRASVIQPVGGVGAAYEVNWRVDRIRDGDVVLVRDDPSNPNVPSATRVIPLRTDDLSVTRKDGEDQGRGIESEIREMKERLEKMAAAEAARKRSEEGTNP